MKVKVTEIGGKIVKEDDRYIVKDNTILNNLVLSSTRLNSEKETSGHNHSGQEEIYFFIAGQGEMQLDDNKFPVNPKDIILVKDGSFHKVYNTNDEELYFICILQGKRKV